MKLPATQDLLWPGYVVKTVDLSTGVTLHYAEQGLAGGVPVIFLHGLSDSWHSFEKLLQHLPASIHAYAISLRGHGDSEKIEGDYDPAAMATDVAAFINKINAGPAVIVGHSMGASVAQRFSLDYPQLTKGLVLIASFASFADNADMVGLHKAIHQLNDPVDAGFVLEFQKSTIEKNIPEADLDTYVAESHKMPARAWKAAMDGLMTADYQKELHRILVPTLLIRGDKDRIVPWSDQEKFLSLINNSWIISYANTGHAVHWEEPARVAADIQHFIKEQL